MQVSSCSAFSNVRKKKKSFIAYFTNEGLFFIASSLIFGFTNSYKDIHNSFFHLSIGTSLSWLFFIFSLSMPAQTFVHSRVENCKVSISLLTHAAVRMSLVIHAKIRCLHAESSKTVSHIKCSFLLLAKSGEKYHLMKLHTGTLLCHSSLGFEKSAF